MPSILKLELRRPLSQRFLIFVQIPMKIKIFFLTKTIFLGWNPMKGSIAGMNGIRGPAKWFSAVEGG